MVDFFEFPDQRLNKQTDQWDEALRGKKMSESTGKVIFKYQMPVLEKFMMKLPKGAEIIRMADQGGMFWLWAVVDTNVPDEERTFYAVKCGANVPEIDGLVYRGFCAIHVQQELGLYIFEEVRKETHDIKHEGVQKTFSVDVGDAPANLVDEVFREVEAKEKKASPIESVQDQCYKLLCTNKYIKDHLESARTLALRIVEKTGLYVKIFPDNVYDYILIRPEFVNLNASFFVYPDNTYYYSLYRNSSGVLQGNLAVNHTDLPQEVIDFFK